jgi:UPF0755 protein
MTEPSLLMGDGLEPPRRRGHRAEKKRRFAGCLPMLLAIAGFAVLAVVFVPKGIDEVKGIFAGPEDYSGPGQGEVVVVIDPGQSVSSMGEELAEEGVVASADAFVDAASANPDATGMQAGTYLLKKEMKAADVVEVLADPANIVQTMVTVPEGLRVVDIVDILAKETDFSRKQYEKALAQPGRIGLPDYAGGDAEGYLFPATYPVSPADTPQSILAAMVDRWRESATTNDLEAGAEQLGYTPHEIMTIASLVEAEGRGDDMAKIARVIYNRLEGPGDQRGTNGRLQIDATVNYALDRKGVVAVTVDEIETTDSPYNTYLNPGLPPGPIEAPGDEAIRAALNPADGDWYYYVTVDLRTGETKFAETYDEFLRFKEDYRRYCETSERC